uniref:Uncharacterized protein n=1 Tax=Glossina pallidipes TaxID=7398 RepID=A0A1B0A862_GLOPL
MMSSLPLCDFESAPITCIESKVEPRADQEHHNHLVHDVSGCKLLMLQHINYVDYFQYYWANSVMFSGFSYLKKQKANSAVSKTLLLGKSKKSVVMTAARGDDDDDVDVFIMSTFVVVNGDKK